MGSVALSLEIWRKIADDEVFSIMDNQMERPLAVFHYAQKLIQHQCCFGSELNEETFKRWQLDVLFAASAQQLLQYQRGY